MNEEKKNLSGIFDAVQRLLEHRLKLAIEEGSDRGLNLANCVKIYTVIFDTLVEVFDSAKIKLTNEGMNYLAQQVYDGVKVNGQHELDPNVFTERAKIENISTKELALLATILRGTDFFYPVMHAIKQRN